MAIKRPAPGPMPNPCPLKPVAMLVIRNNRKDNEQLSNDTKVKYQSLLGGSKEILCFLIISKGIIQVLGRVDHSRVVLVSRVEVVRSTSQL